MYMNKQNLKHKILKQLNDNRQATKLTISTKIKPDEINSVLFPVSMHWRFDHTDEAECK